MLIYYLTCVLIFICTFYSYFSLILCFCKCLGSHVLLKMVVVEAVVLEAGSSDNSVTEEVTVELRL